MQPENKKVVAIICRDQDGTWKRVQSVETKKGEKVVLLSTERGLVAVLGELSDEDHQEISRLIENEVLSG